MANAPDWIKNAYRLRLEIEYRRSHGEEFQQLFNRIMRAMHSSDFVDTSAMGQEGDLGCDGFLKSGKIFFALYGPAPYFRITKARAKMRADFDRLLACWTIPTEVRQWIFVVNYPGVHPSLLKLAEELKREIEGLDVYVWSRSDLTQQLLLWGRRSWVENEFGKVDAGSKILAPLSLVPEDTDLPNDEAQLAHRRLWARLTCHKEEMEGLDKKWLKGLVEHPYEYLVAHTQLLLAAIASGTMEGAFDPEKLTIRALQRESGIRGSYSHVRDAWSLPMMILMGDDYNESRPQFSDDLEEVIADMAKVCIFQEILTLTLIRMQARILKKWETDILDDVWMWASEQIKIQPADVESAVAGESE